MTLTKNQYNEIQKEAVNRSIAYFKQTGRIASPYPYLYDMLNEYDNVEFVEGVAKSITFESGQVWIPVISEQHMQRLANEVGQNQAILNGLGKLEGPYIPTEFDCNTLNTIVPESMDYEMHISMRKIKEAVGGSLNKYLAEKLHYTDEQLCKALGAEQIEAAAVAIYNIENKGQGVIVGDQTGVGKGRVAAICAVYAIKNGKLPMFFTKDANLFSDIYRDIIDVGADDGLPMSHPEWKNFNNPVYNRVKPFVVNAMDKDSRIKDENGNIIYQPPPKAEQNRIIKSKKLPDEYDIVLCTYSQINAPKRAKAKIEFTLEMSRRDCVLILDESHMAGGDNPGKDAQGKQNKSGLSNTGDHVLNMIRNAAGAVFLSATFAKRPGNMPIYAEKTCIKDSGMSNADLIEAFNKGGVALQEVVSSQLVAEGQMIRRQRTFENIDVDYDELETKKDEHCAISDNITEIARDIIEFQKMYVTPLINDMDKDMAVDVYGSVKARKGTKQAGVNNDPYFNRVFQVTNQLLFSLKAVDAAKKAIKRLKEGKSVVIALANTMESFLNDFVDEDDKDFAEGDVINVDFSNALLRGLRGVMKITITDAFENKTYRYIEPHELSEQGQVAYYSLVDKIKRNSSGITISPIDVIHHILQQAGYKTLEVTGRKIQVNFVDPNVSKKQNLNGLGAIPKLTVDQFLDKYQGHIFIKNSGSISGLGNASEINLNTLPEKIKIENRGQKKNHVIVTSPDDPEYKNEIEVDSILNYYIPGLDIKENARLSNFNYGTISTQTHKKNKTDAFRLFNENKVDVLIINKSGSTGASAHAKPIKNNATGEWIVPPEKVKPRCGIVVQAELDVNEEVQKRGRINRTGQKYPPIYDYVFTSVPAEKRFMMMLKSKLKSLDANTASDQENSDDLYKSDDFLNKYGDKIALNFMKRNPDFVEMLGDPLKLKDDPERTSFPDAARKITGRCAILPAEDQEKLYTEILEEYHSYLAYLENMGENDLVVSALKLDAKVVDRQVLVPGDTHKSVFATSVFLDTCEINNLRKPYTQTELENLIQAEISDKTSDEQRDFYLSNFTRMQDEKLRQQIQNYNERIDEQIKNITNEKKYQKLEGQAAKEEYFIDRKRDLENMREKQLIKYQQQHEAITNHVTPLFKSFKIGQAIKWPKIVSNDGSDGLTVPGVFLGWRVDMKASNPFAPSKIKLEFAIADSTKRLTLVGSGETYSDITKIIAASRNINMFESQRIIDRWETLTSESSQDRVLRYIITGNVLKGINSTEGKGRLISFTLQDGGTKKGILMPDNWSPEQENREQGNNIALRISRAYEILKNMGSNGRYRTNKKFEIQKGWNDGEVKLVTDGGKVETHKWLIKNPEIQALAQYREGFTKTWDNWAAHFPAQNLKKLIDLLDTYSVTIMVSRSVYEHYFGEVDTNDVKVKDEATIAAEKQFEIDKARYEQMKAKNQTFPPIVEFGVLLKAKN